MTILDISKTDISELNDADLRELIGRLCEEEFRTKDLTPSGVLWGGAQTAADGGLDIETITDPKNKFIGFIPRCHTGFQVKKSSMGKQACFNEMHAHGKLRPIIKQLISESGAYIIISGKDDCSGSMLKNRIKKMREAVKSNPEHENLHIDFYGRDRIATWMRQHPNVILWFRKITGIPLEGWSGYGRWARTPSEIDDPYLINDSLCIIDSNTADKESISIAEGIKRLRSTLSNPRKAARLTGLSGVGKTRLAQALFESEVGEKPLNRSHVIYADLGEELAPSANEMLTQLVRRQGFWFQRLRNLSEYLAHLVSFIMRRTCGVASAGFRVFCV